MYTTIEATHDRFVHVSLLNHDFNMRIIAGNGFQVLEEEGACVSRGWPPFAVFKDQLADVWYERGMAVRRPCCNASSQ